MISGNLLHVLGIENTVAVNVVFFVFSCFLQFKIRRWLKESSKSLKNTYDELFSKSTIIIVSTFKCLSVYDMVEFTNKWLRNDDLIQILRWTDLANFSTVIYYI